MMHEHVFAVKPTTSEEDRDDRDEDDQHRDDVRHRQRQSTRDHSVLIAKNHVDQMPACCLRETDSHATPLFSRKGVHGAWTAADNRNGLFAA